MSTASEKSIVTCVSPAPTFVDAFGLELSINGWAYANGKETAITRKRKIKIFFN